MAVFGKFFRKKNQPRSSEEEESASAKKQRAPRVRVNPLLGASLLSADGRTIPLINISVTGLGVRDEHPENWPPVGKLTGYALKLNEKTIPVELRVVHLSGEIVGCSFHQPSPDLQPTIQKYFSVQLSAMAMNHVNPEVVQKTDEGEPHWFLGENNCELYFIADLKKDIVRFHLSFFGNFLERSTAGVLRYGRIAKDPSSHKPGMKGSDLIHWDSRIPKEIISSVVEYLEHVPDLESRFLVQLKNFVQPS